MKREEETISVQSMGTFLLKSSFQEIILVLILRKVIQSNSFDNMNPGGLNFPCFVSKGLFVQESELWQRLKTYVKRCLKTVVWPESFFHKKVVNLLGK